MKLPALLKLVISSFVIILIISSAQAQYQFKILPLGNSITADTASLDLRPTGDRKSYRYKLYQWLTQNSYQFDYIGNRNGGGNFLPVPEYDDHAGFPGITPGELLTLLQTGMWNSNCQLPSCSQNYLSYYNPDIILLHIGTNGLNTNTNAENHRDDVISILNVIDNYEASTNKVVPVFLCQIINRSPDGAHSPTTYYNSLLADVVTSRPTDNLILVNMETGAGINYNLTSLGGDMYDLLHPDTSGYRKMGDMFYSSIAANNFRPVLNNVSFSVNENSVNGTTVGTVTGYDFNPTNTISYSIVNSLPSSAFSIASGTGQITVSNSGALNYESSPVFTLTVRATSNGSLTDDATVTINLNNVNEAPVLSGIESSALAYIEGDGAVNITSTIDISDVDNTSFQSATISISSGYNNSQDVLSFTNAFGLTGLWNSILGTLTLSGNTTLSNYRSALRSVKYENTSTDPTTVPRTISFRVNDGNLNSDPVTRNITLSPNTPPVLAGIGVSTLNYIENDPSIQITNTITITDVDNVNMVSGLVSITSGFQTGQDLLSFVDQNGINGTYNSSTGLLTLNGAATIANYRTALRSVRYSNQSENPTEDIRVIQYTVNDGFNNSNAVTRNISVTAVNDAPVLSAIESTPIAYAAGDDPVNITGAIDISDVDNTVFQTATIIISSGYHSSQDVLSFTNSFGLTGLWNSSSGTLTLTGNTTLANYRSALRNVNYENTSTNPNTATRTITFRVNDGTTNSNPVARNITITANTPPVLAGIGVSTLNYIENAASIQITNTLTITDVDNVNMVSGLVSIISGFQTNQDTLSFINQNGIIGTYSSLTGVLTLTGTATIANYRTALRSVRFSNLSEDPTEDVRVIQYTVNDGFNNSNDVTRNISVTAVNDKPVLSGIETANILFTEGDPDVLLTNSITVTDTDNINLSNATISVSSGYQNGKDILTFTNAFGLTGTWNATAGILTLSGNTTKANYRSALRSVRYRNLSTNPGGGNRVVSFVVNDGASNSDPVTRTIIVTTINDPPQLSSVELSTAAYTEGTQVIITSTLALNDLDNLNLVSADVTISGNYQTGEDSLIYSGSVPGITAAWNEATGNLRLQGNSLVSDYQAALRAISFTTDDNPNAGLRIVSITASDSLLQGNTVTRNINVTPVDDPPVLSQTNISAITYTEGTPVIVAGTIKISDPDNPIVSKAAVRITGNYQIGEDTLIYGGSLTSSWNETTGTLTLTGTGSTTIAAFQNELRNISYSTANNPNNSVRTVSFRIYNIADSSNVLTKNINVIPVDDLPYATNVSINAPNIQVGSIITGSFTYNDYESDPQGTHIYKWYRATNSSGLNKSLIAGATTNVYQLKQSDGLKYIAFEVTPVQTSPPNTGLPVISGWLGPIGETRPTANLAGGGNICPDGSLATLTITLTGIPKWRIVLHRAFGSSEDSTIISNIASSPYTLQTSNIGTYTIKSVADSFYTTPVNTGTGTADVNIITSPRAALSGTATICPYDTAVLQVLFNGPQPWNITYTRNGLNPTTITNIFDTDSTYNLKVFGQGLYRLTSVSHGAQIGCVSGTGQVNHRTLPTATLSGGGEICENTSGSLSVLLTGTSPWNIKYKKDNIITDSINNIVSSPRTIPVTEPYRLTPYTYTLLEVTDRYCIGTISGNAAITVLKAPEPVIVGLKPTYSISSAADTAIGRPSGGTFSGPSLVLPNDSSGVFIPWLLSKGQYNIIYTYQSPNTCWGSDTAKITILDKVADILFPGYPDNERLIYCKNDAPIRIEGSNIENVIGSFSMSPPSALTNNGNNIATIDPSKLSGGVYNVVYNNSVQVITRSFNVGLAPTADFTWATECFSQGTPINFTDNSTSNNYGTINSYSWKFFQGENFESKTGSNTSYIFTEPQNYTVEHRITTNYGCKDSISKTFPLRPTIPLSQGTYFENFESGINGWSTGMETNSETNSWSFGEPSDGFTGAASGIKSWYTNVTPGTNEQSWVTSPCFDFSNSLKPMIKISIWRIFDQLRDGAVLQYTDNNGVNWNNIGDENEGINWYNEHAISGKPGGITNSIGWSNIKDTKWMEARHDLDELIGKNNVQFRLAYGSTDLATNSKGIAFDNIQIGNRQKIVLLEHFTNTSSALSIESDSIIKYVTNQYPGDVLDLQYHTSFPGFDPFNDLNPVIPGTRVYYYGINNVPYTLLDGGISAEKRFNYTLKELTAKDVNTQSLYDPSFRLKVISEISGNSLDIQAEIIALENIPAKELTLHLVILEKEITGIEEVGASKIFRNTVNAMVPNAAGTYYYRNWNVNDKETVHYSWTMNNVFDVDQLRVVAFIQDAQTDEVFQARIDISDFPSGLEKDKYLQEYKFMIYPNPAKENIYVRFNQPAGINNKLMIFNITGNLVHSEIVEPGAEEMEINLFNFDRGLYFIQIINNKQIMGLQKLIKIE